LCFREEEKNAGVIHGLNDGMTPEMQDKMIQILMTPGFNPGLIAHGIPAEFKKKYSEGGGVYNINTSEVVFLSSRYLSFPSVR
jgi:hypothetical protein